MKSPDEAPLVSIVIPTRNRPQAILECVSACLALDCPGGGYEILVIDDGSEPPVAAFGDSVVKVIRQPWTGPAAARNRGIQAASGTWIAFTDDDCRPHRDWLVRLANRLCAAPDSMVGGHTINCLTRNPYAAASQLVVDFIYEYFERYPRRRFFTSNNLAGSRERLIALGGFDQGFPFAAAEDRDLCDRWLEGGGSLVYEPAAAVDHSHRMSFTGYLRQHFRYGRGAWLLKTKRAERGRSFGPEPPEFYLGLFTAPFRRGSPGMPLRLLALLFLSQVLNVAGYIVEGRSHPRNKTGVVNPY